MKILLYISKTMRFHLILLLVLFLVSCDDCETTDGNPSLNHFWNFTNGTEVSSNGYYLNYPDGIVTTSSNTIQHSYNDQINNFGGLQSINFISDGQNSWQDNAEVCDGDQGVTTSHDPNGVFEKTYETNGISETFIGNYDFKVMENDGNDISSQYSGILPVWPYDATWLGQCQCARNRIFIQMDDYSYLLDIENFDDNTNSLTLHRSEIDTFSYHLDPLNDTVYWYSSEQTRQYTRDN